MTHSTQFPSVTKSRRTKLDGSSQCLNFAKSYPSLEARPEREVSLMLLSLRRYPLQTFLEATDRDLTLIAFSSPCTPLLLFLLPLASAKGVGELHSLLTQVHHSEGWYSFTFSFMPDFVAKTLNPCVPDDGFDGLSVASFREFLDNDPNKMALCPVRAV